MTLYTARAVIVIAAKDQAAANAVCEAVAKGGSGTFTVPVYDATDTLAGYLCNWQMLPSEAAALKDAFSKANIVPLRWADCDNWDPKLSTVSGETVLTALGLKPATVAVQAPAFARAAEMPKVAVPTPTLVTRVRQVVARPVRWLARWWMRFLAWVRRLFGYGD